MSNSILNWIPKMAKTCDVSYLVMFQEKAETEFRRLRQSFCFKARPLPTFYKEIETPKNLMKVPVQHDHFKVTCTLCVTSCKYDSCSCDFLCRLPKQI